MSTGEYEMRYKVLNKAQKQAVDTIEGPVIVIAGPGTGKTTILTLRIANILRSTDTAPENILALTFTESGAYVMRRKLAELIGTPAYKVNIHTFHGFAEKIIQEYPDYFSRIIGSKIITDAEQMKIIEKIIQAKEIDILRPYGDPSYYVKPILNEIHILKRENISPEDLIKSIKKDINSRSNNAKGNKELSATEIERLKKRDLKNTELALVYERYEEELTKQKFYDFDDMLLELIKAMEGDKTFKLMLQETYQYILADEHQDANASQNRILELLADFHDSPNLFIVGDDKQAIYRFQGASLENFLYFSNKYKDVKVIELEHNYRSHQGILDVAHSLIVNNPSIPGRDRVSLVSLQVGTKPTFISEYNSKDDELHYISLVISGLIKRGEKADEIAVLYRENKEAKDIASALRAHGVNCRIESDHNILEDVDAVKIVLICRAVNDLSNNEALGKVLLLPEMGCDPATVSEIFNYSNKERLPLYRVVDELKVNTKVSPFSKLNKKRLVEIQQAYSKLVSWSKQGQVLTFPHLLQKIIQETKMIGYIVSAPNSLERMNFLEALFDRVQKVAKSKETFHLSDFIEYIDIVSKHGILSKRSYTDHVGGVRLMTTHRAKGLEFDHVFIVNVTDGIWGNRSHRNLFSVPVMEHARDTGRIEDERRLFYVAMTRARKSINISYSRVVDEKERIPSQFIAELDKSLTIMEKPDIIPSEKSLFEKKLTPSVHSSAPTILDPDFVKSKFLSQPFSVTHLNSFLECPWKYFFVNLLRVPQAQNKHQMYGTAVHATLRSFFEAYKSERDMSKADLLRLFAHNLAKEPMSVEDRSNSLKKGNEALSGYFEAYKGLWNRNLLTEYGIKVGDFDLDSGISSSSKLPASLILTGKLDKIDLLDERHVGVIDFKTSKPKSRNDIEGKTKSADGNYKRQLVFYKLLLDRDKKFVMNYGEIDFIEPNERGKYKKERFDITAKEVADLEVLIRKSAKAIINLFFIHSTCDDKDCEYCKLAKVIGVR
jgi:DNA helicase-2/ATP-dependent DNA helicase PcrA